MEKVSWVLKPLIPASPEVFAFLQNLLPWLPGKGGRGPGEALAGLDPAFLEKLRRHRLTPWLYREVAQHGWESHLAPSLLDSLRGDYVAGLRALARVEEEFCRVIEGLAAAGVEFILLKGADLGVRLYAEPAVRPIADLDILVHPRQVSRAQAALTGLGYQLSPWYHDPRPGYRRRFGHALEFRGQPDLPPVDLHWQILAMGDFYRLPYHLLEPRTVSGNYRGLPVRLLGSEDLLIHLCLRGLNDNFESFFQFLDLVLALSCLNLDWPLVVEQASRLHCQRPVYLILRDLARLFPRLVPPSILAQLSQYLPPWYERLALSHKMRYLTFNFPMLYRHYPLRDWPKYYEGKLWPRSEYLAANYGRPDRLAYLRAILGGLRAGL